MEPEIEYAFAKNAAWMSLFVRTNYGGRKLSVGGS